MTHLYVDATTLIALGTVGELEQLPAVQTPLFVLPAIQAEVTTQPAAANLESFLQSESVSTEPPTTVDDERAMEVLGETTVNGDVRLIGAVLAHTAAGDSVAVVSDDRRVRTVADGLGATVTGTIGVLVRAVEAGLSTEDARRIVRAIDTNGLHMTAQLRAKAMELLDEAGSQ
jgi:predicted nucleic acid-binding protein